MPDPHAPQPSSDPSGERRLAPAEPLGLSIWAIALAGFALRAWEAAESSLWLDELHTLYHASQPSLGAVASSVRQDVHTPLFFACVHLFGGWEAGAWLRAIPILSSLLALVPLLFLCRALELSRRASLLAAWLYVCLPYQVLYGTELRPYAWLGVLSALAFAVAFSERGGKLARLALFCLCVLAGLWTHPAMAVPVLAIGCARLFYRRPGMVGLPALVGAGALAAAGFLPWFLQFLNRASADREKFSEELGEFRPALAKELLALPSRLFSPFIRELGSPWSIVELAGGALFLCAAATAFVLWSRDRRGGRSSILRGLALFAATEFVLLTAISIYRWDRAPLQYYTVVAWTLPLFLALFADSISLRKPRRFALGGLALGGLVMAVGLCGGRSREDMRAAVRVARELGGDLEATPGTGKALYTALLTQPSLFPDALPYLAYARDLAPVEPANLPRPGQLDFARPVIVIRRVLPLRYDDWLPITEGRRRAREVKVDRYLTVYVFVASGL
jgi:hypothetical protein